MTDEGPGDDGPDVVTGQGAPLPGEEGLKRALDSSRPLSTNYRYMLVIKL